MKIISTVATTAQKLSGKPLGVMSKALGIASAAAIIYDAHVNGRERANGIAEVETADRFYNDYYQYLSSDSGSATTGKMKKTWFEIKTALPFYEPLSRTKGYLYGVTKTLTEELPVLFLSATALIFGKHAFIGKKCSKLGNAIGKTAGAMLALNVTDKILYEVIGVGKKKEKLSKL